MIKRLYLVGVSTSKMILLYFTVIWSMEYDLNINLFNSLSLIGYLSLASEELKTKKIFVQHVETLRSSDATVDIVQSFVVSTLVSY